MKDFTDIIIAPVITEKAAIQAEANIYTFKVAKDANKIEIKKAIEEIFKVKVVDVNTVRINGKMKRMGRYEGKTSDYKKAIVQLAEGDSIEIFEGM